MTAPRYVVSPENVKHIRRLDVAWAHKFMTKLRGYPFVPGPSDVTAKFYTADENALIALHKMRTEVGNKREMIASREWLRKEGLTGMLGATLADN